MFRPGIGRTPKFVSQLGVVAAEMAQPVRPSSGQDIHGYYPHLTISIPVISAHWETNTFARTARPTLLTQKQNFTFHTFITMGDIKFYTK